MRNKSGRFVPGHTGYHGFKGKTHSEKVREKLRKANIGNMNHWMGDAVGYQGIHIWLNKKFGKADMCENKGCVYPRKKSNGYVLLKPKRFEWAKLKNKPYQRLRKYFIKLCVSCHHYYDQGNKEIIL
jgi:hypothetical protein